MERELDCQERMHICGVDRDEPLMDARASNNGCWVSVRLPESEAERRLRAFEASRDMDEDEEDEGEDSAGNRRTRSPRATRIVPALQRGVRYTSGGVAGEKQDADTTHMRDGMRGAAAAEGG